MAEPGTTEPVQGEPPTDDRQPAVDEHGRLTGPDESRRFGVPSRWR